MNNYDTEELLSWLLLNPELIDFDMSPNLPSPPPIPPIVKIENNCGYEPEAIAMLASNILCNPLESDYLNVNNFTASNYISDISRDVISQEHDSKDFYKGNYEIIFIREVSINR